MLISSIIDLSSVALMITIESPKMINDTTLDFLASWGPLKRVYASTRLFGAIPRPQAYDATFSL